MDSHFGSEETMQLIPAAQYLRMSTEHQQYSFENQISAIRDYAERSGFTIVQSYSDAAKSGLFLKNRVGLKQLLNDVVAGSQSFKVVLVYDISRWGRFQDADEAAHYEFLCKRAGVAVHYCAEAFTNDGSVSNALLKALKRTMAAEYSRELSAKVLNGCRRLAALGWRQGGVPGYGYRRLLVSATGEPKAQLLSGQRKNIQEDRVRLILGPAVEVDCVREIFRMYVEGGKLPLEIAKELNLRGILYTGVKRGQ